VKGLEFDRVIVLGSASTFPFKEDDNIGLAAAEEARLWYVAMTRAKDHLTTIIEKNGREAAWFKCESFGLETNEQALANKPYYLEGDYEEFVVSWSAYNNQRSIDGYTVIEQEINVGQNVSLNNGYIVINNKRIGKLSERAIRTVGLRQCDNLRVMAVIRYPVDLTTKEAEKFTSAITQQGWTYLVLVAGVLAP
jgi:hypothetical protein